VASLGNFPYYLVSNNPAVKTIADFTDKDRIALPAVGVSVQSRVLQMASAKLWGYKEFNRLDKNQVALPHPDAAAAIIKGGTEITGHFGNPPFQEQELAGNPKAKIVLNSYDVLGGPASATVLYATEKFRAESPKTYKAFVDALDEAAKFVAANPEKAADIYLKVSGGNTDRGLLLKIIQNPEVQFKVRPENTLGMGQFGDGGLMASKPYVASGKYIQRMSNHCKGCKYEPAQSTGPQACPYTTLYWDFLNRHEVLLKKNPRMAMQLKNLGRLDVAARDAIAAQATAHRQASSRA